MRAISSAEKQFPLPLPMCASFLISSITELFNSQLLPSTLTTTHGKWIKTIADGKCTNAGGVRVPYGYERNVNE